MPATASDVLQFPVTKATQNARRTFKDERQLAALKAPAVGCIEVADAKVKGLSVRVTAANNRSFSFRYANPQGKMKRIVLGNLQDMKLEAARAKVSEFRVILKGGPGVPPRDPAYIREETRTAVTFGTLAEQWFAEKAIHLKRKGNRERQMYDADLAHWATRPANEIARAELVDTLNKKSNRGKLVASNRLRSLISRIYRFAIQNGRIPVTANPVPGTVKHKERPRERVLTQDEIREVWTACCQFLPIHQRVWFLLRLLTGQRSADIIQMRWADLDVPSKGFWSLPGAFTKNGHPHTVYLASLAQELLALLPRRKEDGPFDPVWVFPACGTGNPKDGTVRNTASFDVMGDYGKINRRLAQPSRMESVRKRVKAAREAGKPKKTDKRGWATRVGAEFTEFTGHDMRRTMITITSTGGVSDQLLERILNHKKQSGSVVSSTYNHNAFNIDKQAIMEYWDKQVRWMLAAAPGTNDNAEVVRQVGAYKGTAEHPAVAAMIEMQAVLADAPLTEQQRDHIASLMRVSGALAR